MLQPARGVVRSPSHKRGGVSLQRGSADRENWCGNSEQQGSSRLGEWEIESIWEQLEVGREDGGIQRALS